MKLFLLPACGFFFLLSSTCGFAGNPPVNPFNPPAQNNSGVTLGAEIGDFWVPSLSLGAPLTVDMKFKNGWGFDVPLGYDFGNGFALSLSAGYDKVDFQSVTGILGGSRQSASTSGTMKMYPVMANAAYSIQLAKRLSWTLGGGVGAVYNNTAFKTFDDDSDKSITFGRLGYAKAVFDGMDDTSWNLGLQATTGLSFQMTSNASLNLGYHYLHTSDKISVNGDSGNITGHMASLGLLWKF